MWFLWTLITFVFLGWIGYVWLKTLASKYEHTVESIVTLVVLLVLVILLSLKLTYVMAPAWSTWPRLVLTTGLGFVLFVGFSFTAVNLWCSFLTRGFDDRIGFLEEEQDRLQRRLDILRWKRINEDIPLHAPDNSYETGYCPDSDVMEELRKFIDEWQQSGGAARIRSIKVMEWKEEAGKASVEELRDKINALTVESEIAADEVKKEHAKAKLAVMRTEIAQRQQSQPNRAGESFSRGHLVGARPEAETETIRKNLQRIHGELQIIEAQKREFLRGRIRLSWRVRS
ncbi:MAG: hypothetical protein ACOX4K_08630 [Bacillota bacterium]|jgi:ubiquitin